MWVAPAPAPTPAYAAHWVVPSANLLAQGGVQRVEGRQCRSRLAGHFLVIVWNSEFEQIIAIDFIFIILHKYVFYDPIMANIRKP